MESETQWLTTKFDLSMLRDIPVKILDRAGREKQGRLEIENVNEDGKIEIYANYNSSHSPEKTVIWEKFYLTQAQLDDFQNNGAKCVLIAPAKI
jgi:hypothetical protein